MPSAAGARPAATAAPEPLLDPPGVYPARCGFSQRPNHGLSPVAPSAASCMFSLPRITAPAALTTRPRRCSGADAARRRQAPQRRCRPIATNPVWHLFSAPAGRRLPDARAPASASSRIPDERAEHRRGPRPRYVASSEVILHDRASASAVTPDHASGRGAGSASAASRCRPAVRASPGRELDRHFSARSLRRRARDTRLGAPAPPREPRRTQSASRPARARGRRNRRRSRWPCNAAIDAEHADPGVAQCCRCGRGAVMRRRLSLSGEASARSPVTSWVLKRIIG